MSELPGNVHGTAIVLGTRGFLLLGPSGAGKSTLALALMAGARRDGHYAALISDDQVMISTVDGHVLAEAPETIAGLIEIRGAGITTVETVACAVIDFALRPIQDPDAERLPAQEERHPVRPGVSLPVLRLPFGKGQDSLAILSCLLPQNTPFDV